jgi:hypothetical protein
LFNLFVLERTVFPIGQRSFTSPASVMQPFKAQLSGQTPLNPYSKYYLLIRLKLISKFFSLAPSNDMIRQSTSPTNSHQSLFLSYGIVTFNKNQLDCLSDGSTIDRRLNSDVSLMSQSHQQQPSNIYSLDDILSSSSSSHIFRTLSLSTNNIGDNTSGHIRTSHGSIIFFDENCSDQTTNYLLGPPSTTLIDDTNLQKSISRSHLSHIDEEKLLLNDSYALIEPLNLENSSLISTESTIVIKPSEKSINYTDLLLPSNTDDEQQQEFYSSDDNNELSSTILYTDIDCHQTQRRDRIAKFAAISKIEDQIPPFVL